MLQVCTMDGCCVCRRRCSFASILPCWQCRCASRTCFLYDSLLCSFKFAFGLRPRRRQAKVPGIACANFGEKNHVRSEEKKLPFSTLGPCKGRSPESIPFSVAESVFAKPDLNQTENVETFSAQRNGLARLKKPSRPACTQDFEWKRVLSEEQGLLNAKKGVLNEDYARGLERKKKKRLLNGIFCANLGPDCAVVRHGQISATNPGTTYF